MRVDHRPPGPFLIAAGVLVGAWLVAPLAVVVPMGFTDARTFEFPPETYSLRWYENLVNDPAWVDAFLQSLTIALIVTALATVLGTMTAFGLVRASDRVRSVIVGLVLFPLDRKSVV